jgi:hypothetical protein
LLLCHRVSRSLLLLCHIGTRLTLTIWIALSADKALTLLNTLIF